MKKLILFSFLVLSACASQPQNVTTPIIGSVDYFYDEWKAAEKQYGVPPEKFKTLYKQSLKTVNHYQIQEAQKKIK